MDTVNDIVRHGEPCGVGTINDSAQIEAEKSLIPYTLPVGHNASAPIVLVTMLLS